MPSFLTTVLSLLILLPAGALCAEAEAAEAVETEAEDAKPDTDASAGPLRAEEKKEDEDEDGDEAKDNTKDEDKDEDEDDLPARLDLPQKPAGYDEKLDQIVLPENPTREQVKDYIKALNELVQSKRMFSTQDPEVGKLNAVPAKHYDLVLSLMYDHSRLSFYAEYAIAKIDPEDLREHVAAQLADNPNLIGLLVTYGWLEDARSVIMSKFEAAEPGVSTAWYQAFVELAEPKHYEQLHKLAVGSPQAAECIALLKSLPDYDLTRTINACWDKRKQSNRPQHFRMHYHDPQASLAAHAAGIGKVDALGQLINNLEHNRPTRSYGRQNGINQARLDVTRFIAFRGTNQQIKAWYEANKKKLVFDHQKQRFVVEEDF